MLVKMKKRVPYQGKYLQIGETVNVDTVIANAWINIGKAEEVASGKVEVGSEKQKTKSQKQQKPETTETTETN